LIKYLAEFTTFGNMAHEWASVLVVETIAA